MKQRSRDHRDEDYPSLPEATDTFSTIVTRFCVGGGRCIVLIFKADLSVVVAYKPSPSDWRGSAFKISLSS